jgi:hypothetical protein
MDDVRRKIVSEEGCFTSIFERKYYRKGDIFVKRSLPFLARFHDKIALNRILVNEIYDGFQRGERAIPRRGCYTDHVGYSADVREVS